MNRIPLLAGNWKLNHGGASGANLALEIAAGLSKSGATGVEVVLGPPFTALAAVAACVEDAKQGSGLKVPLEVAGQNLHYADNGAFTGEISAAMLKECGCRWVIIGHSERRQLFGETDEGVAKKVTAALQAGLRPIVCVGETLEQREAGRTLNVVFEQLDAVSELLAREPGRGVIAYEPVWAIGTGKVAGPDQAEEVHAAIRKRLIEITEDFAEKTRILYGGSVKPDNAEGLLTCPNVDGALVGGASLKAESFLGIIAATPRS